MPATSFPKPSVSTVNFVVLRSNLPVLNAVNDLVVTAHSADTFRFDICHEMERLVSL